MPLAAALPAYKSDIQTSYETLGNEASDSASDISTATKTWALNGIPTTLNTGVPPLKGLAPGQVIAGFVTTTPGTVTADGLGGIDTSSPGPGLASVKAALVSALITSFSNTGNSAADAAGDFTDAVNDFFSKAGAQTLITATIPPGLPVPAPAGPVPPGVYTGTGVGGIDSATPGVGLSAVEAAFVSDLEAVFSNTGNSASDAASGIADACEAFLSKAKVDTTDSGSAGGGPATVDPNTGSGSTGPSGSPIISGSSLTGVLS